jgi:hypothetical protein
MNSKLQTAAVLSHIIAVLAAIASAGGLLLPHLYRDNLFVKSAWRGNDGVTVTLPILLASVWWARRSSVRAQLVWMGALDYLLYNFAFYLFGAAFNAFFLLYVALFTLSILALNYGLLGIDAEAIRQQFRDQTPVKWISGYMVFIALGLGSVYVMQSVQFIFTGELPGIVTTTQHPTSVVFALDLRRRFSGGITDKVSRDGRCLHIAMATRTPGATSYRSLQRADYAIGLNGQQVPTS